MSERSMAEIDDVEVIREGLKATILPAGPFVAPVVGTLKPKLQVLLEDGVGTVVFDLARTTVVDSAAIGVIVTAHSSVRKSGGSVSIVHASRDLLDLFEVLRLNRHFPVTGQ